MKMEWNEITGGDKSGQKREKGHCFSALCVGMNHS